MDKCQWRCDHCDLLMDDPEICCVPPTPTVAADAAAPSDGRADCGETLPGVFTNADDLIAALNLPDERAAFDKFWLDHAGMDPDDDMSAEETASAAFSAGVSFARATAPQATVKGDERMGLTFEEWASDPVRADKIPLDKHPNGAYSDTRSYLIAFGWKSALKHGAAVPQAVALTDEQIVEFCSEFCSANDLDSRTEHRLSYAFRALLAAHPTEQAEK